MSFRGNNKFKVQQNNPKVAAILEDSSNSNILRVRKLQKFFEVRPLHSQARREIPKVLS